MFWTETVRFLLRVWKGRPWRYLRVGIRADQVALPSPQRHWDPGAQRGFRQTPARWQLDGHGWGSIQTGAYPLFLPSLDGRVFLGTFRPFTITPHMTSANPAPIIGIKQHFKCLILCYSRLVICWIWRHQTPPPIFLRIYFQRWAPLPHFIKRHPLLRYR